MDEFENQPQQPESTQDASGTSRRNFLKVAVVSSAAAAAAVGGAGVAATALASRAPSGLSKLLVLNSNVVSTKNACFTNSAFQDSTGLNTNEGFYVWAWFTLPSGAAGQSYTASILTPDPLPSYLDFQGHKQQKIYQNLTGCQDTGTAPDSTKVIAGTPSDTMPITFTVPAGTNTVLVQVHLNATNAPKNSSLVFTIELKGPSFDETATTTVLFGNV